MRKNANLELVNTEKIKLKEFLKLEKKKKVIEANTKQVDERAKKTLKVKKEQVKIIKNRVKDEMQERKNIWNKFKGIRVKLLLAFSVPIILLAIFGVVSYQKSANAIISNYEKSATNTLNAVSNYLDLGMNTVKEKSVEILLGNSYYDRVIK